MSVENLIFQGINRAISDFSSAGACEELINLRPTTAGLVPVKKFSVKMSGARSDDRVFVHEVSSVSNYIALRKVGYELFVLLVGPNAEGRMSILAEIARISLRSYDYTNFSLDKVHFSAVGNIFMLSIADRVLGIYLNKSFLWNGTEYKETEANIPQISASISTTGISDKVFISSPIASGDLSRIAEGVSLQEELTIAQNALAEDYKDLCFGPILVAFAFKTKDNKTFWTNQWLFHNPIPDIEGSETFLSQSEIPAALQQYFPAGAFAFYKEVVNTGEGQYRGAGAQLELTIQRIQGWNEETSMLSSLEVYTSRPVFYFDAATSKYKWYADAANFYILFPKVELDELGLDNQLLYLQKSIPLGELVGTGSYSFQLEFGGNIQMTGATLEVDGGSVTRYGQMLAYNARFHFFDSVKKTELRPEDIHFHYESTSAAEVSVSIVAVVENENRQELVYLGDRTLPAETDVPSLVIVPSLQVVALYVVYPGDYWARIGLSPSRRYNYAISTDIVYTRSPLPVPDDVQQAIDAGAKEFFLTEEPDAINVTEQLNPFVFQVRHSYLAPGKILDVQPQMVAVKDVSFGDYPLNVFTNRGTYALLQGDGTTLYGGFKSVSNLVTTANSIPTESGTFFIAAGGLWAIAGSDAVLVSDALHLGPHKFIRRTAGFIYIARTHFHFEGLQSIDTFEDYVAGAKLSYNRYRDELMVSNPGRSYTYVLSLKYRQWFKIGITISQDLAGGDVAICPAADNTKNIVDLSTEESGSVLVHLQSRPFSMLYQYIHVHRIVAMIRASLSANDELIVALYGSDDLQDWKILSYAGRSGVDISQIRTPSAARSWRYYTVCISGNTPPDTDFGPVLFDYQPVVRRLG